MVGSFSRWRIPQSNSVSESHSWWSHRFLNYSFFNGICGGEQITSHAYGRVEFEYKVVLSKATQPNVYFCMILMQETGIGRTGLIEAGTNVQGDPQNLYSPTGNGFMSQWNITETDTGLKKEYLLISVKHQRHFTAYLRPESTKGVAILRPPMSSQRIYRLFLPNKI